MKKGPAESEKLYAEVRKKEKLKDLEFREDLQFLLKQPQFRRWAVWLIYGLCGVNKSIWESSAKIHMLEGRRSAGLDVLATFTRFPDLYFGFERDRIAAEVEQLSMREAKLSAEQGDDNG